VGIPFALQRRGNGREGPSRHRRTGLLLLAEPGAFLALRSGRAEIQIAPAPDFAKPNTQPRPSCAGRTVAGRTSGCVQRSGH
jgi:hypothetical protein